MERFDSFMNSLVFHCNTGMNRAFYLYDFSPFSSKFQNLKSFLWGFLSFITTNDAMGRFDSCINSLIFIAIVAWKGLFTCMRYLLFETCAMSPHTFHLFFLFFLTSWTLSSKRNINFSSRYSISNSSGLCKLFACVLQTVHSWFHHLMNFFYGPWQF